MSSSHPAAAGVSLPYAGDISAQEAWDMLSQDANALLVDVRTQAEWAFVGEPDLSSLQKQPLRLSWRTFPLMQVNPDFLAYFSQANIATDTPLLFLCKVGGRSADAAAALTEAGWSHCYNIAYGFEGDSNPSGQRGTLNGWKATSLPWQQN